MLAVVGVVAAVVLGAVRGGLDEPVGSLPPSGVPEGELHPADVADVRFSVGFRGYRMREVDEVLDRLGDELGRKDDEIARLRGEASGAGPRTEVASTGWTAPEGS
ncbi:hypothetical protein GCM10025868_12750 [Angustibacter aerolatus]|uniref:DivIVA domain-containing protein n=1 Tax=Angustibacter aerolatus TaxID=1162965 RepID=A0ABQ6JCX0_9ACTN|nr:DivIVA domain-containing protein [Angustibacter aerolatus]GMA86025.1 hypothetical protein GCM10025868_12750 [Angustibacter aerolatus]